MAPTWRSYARIRYAVTNVYNRCCIVRTVRMPQKRVWPKHNMFWPNTKYYFVTLFGLTTLPNFWGVRWIYKRKTWRNIFHNPLFFWNILTLTHSSRFKKTTSSVSAQLRSFAYDMDETTVATIICVFACAEAVPVVAESEETSKHTARLLQPRINQAACHRPMQSDDTTASRQLM